MDLVSIIIIMGIALILILTFYLIGVYNKLIDAKNRVEDQFVQIDIQLKNIIDLILTLVEVVNVYAKHEEKILNEVVNARNSMVKVNDIDDQLDSLNKLENSLEKVFSLTKTYPELKSDANFKSVKKEIKNAMDKIDYASSFYNDTVLYYNDLMGQFPLNIVAKVFKFKEIRYCNIDAECEKK